jgi:hypothetical protein
MSSCCCSLAGTAACRTCSNYPFAESPPPVRTYTVSATNPVLITGQKTNADRIRSMTDDALAALCSAPCPPDQTCGRNMCYPLPECVECWKRWLESEAENG